MPKVRIWVDDDEGGTFPIEVVLRREGEKLVIEVDDHKMKIDIDAVMVAITDDVYG